jgi:hypothetical protein
LFHSLKKALGTYAAPENTAGGDVIGKKDELVVSLGQSIVETKAFLKTLGLDLNDILESNQ